MAAADMTNAELDAMLAAINRVIDEAEVITNKLHAEGINGGQLAMGFAQAAAGISVTHGLSLDKHLKLAADAYHRQSKGKNKGKK